MNRILVPYVNGGGGGDCYIFDDNEKNTISYIEVKSGGSGFRRLSTYENMSGYKNTISKIKDELKYGDKEFIRIDEDGNTINPKDKKYEDIDVRYITKTVEINKNKFDDFIGGISCYCLNERRKKNKDMYLVIFDNTYNGRKNAHKTTSGYFVIPITDSFVKIYNTIMDMNIFDIVDIKEEKKGGFGSRDFTIGCEEGNKEKIKIFAKKKKL